MEAAIWPGTSGLDFHRDSADCIDKHSLMHQDRRPSPVFLGNRSISNAADAAPTFFAQPGAARETPRDVHSEALARIYVD
jgi:hypothetical protein